MGVLGTSPARGADADPPPVVRTVTTADEFGSALADCAGPITLILAADLTVPTPTDPPCELTLDLEGHRLTAAAGTSPWPVAHPVTVQDSSAAGDGVFDLGRIAVLGGGIRVTSGRVTSGQITLGAATSLVVEGAGVLVASDPDGSAIYQYFNQAASILVTDGGLLELHSGGLLATTLSGGTVTVTDGGAILTDAELFSAGFPSAVVTVTDGGVISTPKRPFSGFSYVGNVYSVYFNAGEGTLTDPADAYVGRPIFGPSFAAVQAAEARSAGFANATLPTPVPPDGKAFVGWFDGVSGTRVTRDTDLGAFGTASSTARTVFLSAVYAPTFLTVPEVTLNPAPRVGQSVGASVGSVWNPSNPTLAYQWQSASTSDGPFTDLPSATDRTLAVPGSLAGAFLRVRVTATKEGWAPAVVDSPAVQVAPGELTYPSLTVSTTDPSNLVQVDLPATATVGSWGQTVPDAVAIRWETRPSAFSTTWTTVGTGATFTPSASQWAQRLRAVATATKQGYTDRVLTSAEVLVNSGTFSTTPQVTMTGIGRQGTTLSVTAPGASAWEPEATSVTTRWELRKVGDSFGVIDGATGPTLYLDPRTFAPGDQVRYVAIPVRAAYQGGAVASPTMTVSAGTAPTVTSGGAATFVVGAPGAFQVTTQGSPTPAVTVSGDLPVGVTFTAGTDGSGVLSGTPGLGAVGSYPLTVTADNGVGPAVTATLTLTVDPARFATAPTIGIDGTPRVGVPLTASGAATSPAAWTPTAGGLAYRWEVQRSGSSAWTPVGTGANYTPVAADLAGTVRLTVTASAAGHADASTSATAGPVQVGELSLPDLSPEFGGPAVLGQSITISSPVTAALPPDAVVERTLEIETAAGSGTWEPLPTASPYVISEVPDRVGALLRATLSIAVPGYRTVSWRTTTPIRLPFTALTDDTLTLVDHDAAPAATPGDEIVNEQDATLSVPGETSYCRVVRRAPGSDTWIYGGAAPDCRYTLTAADIGSTVVVLRAVSADGYVNIPTTPSLEGDVGFTVETPFEIVPSVAVEGTPEVGRTVTAVGASSAAWTPTPSALTYQWQREATDGTWSDIGTAGADSAGYTVGAGDVGRRLRVRVTATAPDRALTRVVSDAVGPVPAPIVVPPVVPPVDPPSPVGLTAPAVELDGIPQVGAVLTVVGAAAEGWTPAADRVDIVWQIRFGDGDWSTITPPAQRRDPDPAVSATTYVVRPGDLGGRLRAVVTGARTGYLDTPTIAEATADVVLGAWAATPPALRIAGRPVVGRTLRAIGATPETWLPPATEVELRWETSRDGRIWTAAPATGRTFRPTAGDRGRLVRVTAVATAPGYGAGTVAAQTARIARGTLAGPHRFRLRGHPAVGRTLRIPAGVLTGRRWTPRPDAVVVRWQVQRPGAGWHRIDGADRRHLLRVRPEDVGRRLRAVVVVREPGYRTLRVVSRVVRVPR